MKYYIILIILTINTVNILGQIPLGHHLFNDNSVFMNIREVVFREDGIYVIAGIQKPDTSRFEYRSYKLDTKDMELKLIDTLVQNTNLRGGVTDNDLGFFKLPNGDYLCDIIDFNFSYSILDSSFHFKLYKFIENEDVFTTRLLKLANDSTIIAIVEIGPKNSPRKRYIYNYDLDFNIRWRRKLPQYIDFSFFGDMAIIRDSIIVATQFSGTFRGTSPHRSAASIHALTTSNKNFINRIVAQDTSGSDSPQIVYNAEEDILVLTFGDVVQTCCDPQFTHGLMAVDSDYKVLWQRRQSFIDDAGSVIDFFRKSIPSSDHHGVISIGDALDNGWVLNVSKTGWNGDSIWTRRIVYDFGLENSISQPRIWDFDASPDGGYVLSGRQNYTDLDTIRRQEGWLLKVDSAGCVVSGCDDIVSTSESSATGVVMKVFPNPTQDQFQFMIGSTKYAEGIVRIINPQGQFIRQYDYKGSHVTYTVSLGDEPTGVYIVQFLGKNGLVISEKLLKY